MSGRDNLERFIEARREKTLVVRVGVIKEEKMNINDDHGCVKHLDIFYIFNLINHCT